MNFRTCLPNTIVTQLFVNDEQITTQYTIMNFPSLLSPQNAYAVKYIIKVFSGEKRELLNKTYILNPFQSKNITFEDEADLPHLGIVTIEMQPLSLFSKPDYHLKRLTPHFYTKFISKNHDSIGLVHTQTRFNIKGHTHHWKSSLRIDPSMLKKVVAYQINPTTKPFENNLSLHTHHDGKILESKRFQFKKLSAMKQEYIINNEELLYIGVDQTTTPNAKPLLFLYFQDDTFTVVHS